MDALQRRYHREQQSNMRRQFLTGEHVYYNHSKEQFLFLGYSDYKRNWAVIADEHGNKSTVQQHLIHSY